SAAAVRSANWTRRRLPGGRVCRGLGRSAGACLERTCARSYPESRALPVRRAAFLAPHQYRALYVEGRNFSAQRDGWAIARGKPGPFVLGQRSAPRPRSPFRANTYSGDDGDLPAKTKRLVTYARPRGIWPSLEATIRARTA